MSPVLSTALQAQPTDFADSYESLMQFLYQAPIGLVRTTLDGTVEMLNPMSANLLMPLSPSGDLENLFSVLRDVAPQLQAMAEAFDAPTGVICEPTRFELAGVKHPAGAVQVISISLLKLDERNLIAVVTDATLEFLREQRGLAHKLKAALRTDMLTQMPNRDAVIEQLKDLLLNPVEDPAHEFAVLFMNCDRFKQINDTLGHVVGDEVLGLMAERLKSTLRTGDRMTGPADAEQMAARVGGDEFVVVLDHLRRPDDVHSVAQRLIDVLAKPYGVGKHQIYCNVSMGVVMRAQAAADANALLQDASIAMAEAKRAGGRRYVVFEPIMQERASRRGDIESDLRVGLAEGQLFVVYQPVVGLMANGGVDRSTGVEALVRWRHPRRGIVSPLEFVGVAEETGLIGALGAFVLTAACRQFQQWQHELASRAPRLLAVNLSRAQLTDPGLVQSVRDVLNQTGMLPKQLQLEVTESLAAQDELVQSQLHELKAIGLTLALDDFGTGYSSLSSLHQLPIDTVKIDRSFVSLGDTSHHHRVLMEATVRVAASLGMGTVAEGIETMAQAAVVRELGCQKGQGYLFSKPLSSADLVTWLQQDPADPVGT